MMIVGMDFGTTNSGMAVYDGTAVNLLPLDPANKNPNVLRTAIYITTDQAVHVGRAALNHYFEHNVGRAVKMRKVWVGEIEVYTEDLYYVTDAYVYVDVLSPGRLMLSVKTGLRVEDYTGTVIGQYYYSLENLIATYLTTAKIRAEKLLNREIREVVLGRPVRFAVDEEHDKLAQARLLRAALQAGYEKVYFQQEPIAAAYSYETTLSKAQNVLVFDFGGGTLDVTIMRLGDPKQRRVLATGGIPVAGDVFDQKLVRQKLARHFGEGSPYGPRHKNLTVPGWIYDTFSNWQTILELQSQSSKRILEDMSHTARRRYQLEALISLVSNNLGLKMFDVVEQSKRMLSEKRGAEILLEGPDFTVRDFVTRREFENIIRQEILAIDVHLDEVVARSGLKPDQIDAVIRTGGSSQIPVFHNMLAQKFGEEKVKTVDTFSSVTAGLGIVAHRIETGEMELPALTQADDPLPANLTQSKPNVAPVNLDLVQRRILAAEQGAANEAAGQTAVSATKQLVCLEEDGTITVIPDLEEQFQQKESIPHTESGISATIFQIIQAEMDERILMLTDYYRFLLTTPREQIEHKELALGLDDLMTLERDERIIYILRYSEILDTPKLLLITSGGIARPFPFNVLRPQIEAPIPLKFDHSLDGVVVNAWGTDGKPSLVVAAKSGRAVRYPFRALRTSGTQVFNCGKDDRIMAGVLIHDDEPITLITSDGYGRRFLPELVPVPPRPNTKGKSMISRRAPVIIATTAESGWLLTNERLVWGDNGRLPLTTSSKTAPLIELAPSEVVVQFIS